MLKAMRNGAMLGSAVGAGLAIVLIVIDTFGFFPISWHGTLEELTFKLAPLYVLGFWNGISSMIELVLITIIRNTILHGTVFGVIAVVVSLFNRRMA